MKVNFVRCVLRRINLTTPLPTPKLGDRKKARKLRLFFKNSNVNLLDTIWLFVVATVTSLFVEPIFFFFSLLSVGGYKISFVCVIVGIVNIISGTYEWACSNFMCAVILELCFLFKDSTKYIIYFVLYVCVCAYTHVKVCEAILEFLPS